MATKYFEGVGRRKESTARVRIIPDGNALTVNGKEAKEFFTRVGDLERAFSALRAAGRENQLTVSALVSGGGVTGQTEAVRQGVARALVKMDETLRPTLRKEGLLTRDDRMKERKKPGLKRARKAPTYTKR
ncbi:MAG: 30S ribosomal protein S9 [Anaerolineales bacterium]|nr:30S ribosomal protein S9 [Anaerolineales bacterium]